MKQTPLEKRLTKLFAPAIEGGGYRLVCVKIIGAEQAQTVQVMAENPATRALGVEDCAKLSRELSALMDVEDPIKGAYRLEISSPGIDRPLVSLQDFADFTGFEVKIEISPPHNGQKRFRGRIKAADDKDRTFAIVTEDQGEVTLPFAAVEKAKLVMTDELLKKTAAARTA
jgi:ribosome maturation factor RimP